MMQASHALQDIENLFCKKRSISQKRTFTKNDIHEKKSRASALLEKLCRPYFPAILIFVGGATLLVRARAPPETWTTRHWSYDLSVAILVDQIFRLVIIFGNECSKFEQFAK
jgi:hypothetical protein